jgi:hypothetical protein
VNKSAPSEQTGPYRLIGKMAGKIAGKMAGKIARTQTSV